jgi:carboxymethylenebutenolidase
MVLVGLGLSAAGGARAETSAVEFGVHRRMSAELMMPDGPGPFPAILLLHTAAGMEAYDLDYARRLKGEGYVVLAPYFLRAYPAFTLLKAGRRQIFTTHGPSIYDDLVAGLALLRAERKVSGKRVGAVGFSAGGFFAVWLAATGQVQAGVSYYGALTAAGGDDQLERYRRLFNHASSPVLILHGTEDGTVPFAAAVMLDSILTAAQTPHEFYRYPVGHRFDRYGVPASERAAADAWQQTRAFLARTLRK